MIYKSSKPCPRCSTMINRSQGCDHMFCTNCRTHFNYVTGEVYTNSSNHHYNDLASYSRNVITHDPIKYGENVSASSTMTDETLGSQRIMDSLKANGAYERIPKGIWRCVFASLS